MAVEKEHRPCSLVLNLACSACFFSRNSVFSHNNSAGTVFFSQFQQLMLEERRERAHIGREERVAGLELFYKKNCRG